MAGARGKSKLPVLMHVPAYAGFRMFCAATLAGAPRPTIETARRIGRTLAGARFNRSRLERACTNIRVAYPDWCDDAVHEHALAGYEHLFMLAVEASMAPRLLAPETWRRHVALGDIQGSVEHLLSGKPCVLITGHCGNWELLGYSVSLLGFPMHALYRPMDMKPLDRWVRRTRQQRGMTLVDKFGAFTRLPALAARGAPLGFVADQNGGDRGVFVPFFHRLTSSYKSIGLLAMQFNAAVLCGMARRLDSGERTSDGLGYAFEQYDVIEPEEWQAHEDPLFYLTARYRYAIERMVRAAPGQYLWMHRIWRSRPRHERLGRPMPASLAEKIRDLPWITEGDMARITARSEEDARILERTGADRFS